MDYKHAYRCMRNMVDLSPHLICAIDSNKNILQVNKASLQILGYLPADLIGKGYSDLMLDADRQKTDKIITAFRERTEMIYFRNRYFHKNGTLIPL